LLDYVPDEKLPFVYNLARAFVFPSRYEGFGLPVLEAMSCGTPVICSNASSLPEVVGDAGLLIPPDDVDDLAQAMLQITHDEKMRSELRERGLVQSKQFSWEHAARETVKVYQSVFNLKS
jgi:alpha-1,3-rhamnosyl/mannosyltransferase